MQTTSIRSALFILIMAGASAAIATDGTQLIGIGAMQKATAGAGVASPRDATWVLLNPAGMALVGSRLDLSVELFAPERSMTPDGPGLDTMGGMPLANSSAGTSEDDSVYWIPAAGAVWEEDGRAVAAGLYGVCGMGVDYDSPRTTIPLFSGESYDRRAEYCVMKTALAYAQPCGDWYIGAALNGNMARFRTDMLTPAFTQTAGQYEWDTAVGAGFQVGVLRDMGDWAIGATYISRQWMEEFEKYEDLFKESLDLPQMLQAGVAWRPLESLELLLDYKYIDWSGVGQYGDAPEDGGFGWRDQHIVKCGAVYDVCPGVTASMGYSYGNSPISEDVVFANALFPAIVEHHVTAGLGVALSERCALQLTYMHAFENVLEDDGTGDMYSQAGAGTEISLSENTITMQLTRTF